MAVQYPELWYPIVDDIINGQSRFGYLSDKIYISEESSKISNAFINSMDFTFSIYYTFSNIDLGSDINIISSTIGYV